MKYRDADARVARWLILGPKIPFLGMFRRASEWKMLVYFTVIWYILFPFGTIYTILGIGYSLWSFWYTFPVLVCFDQGKSGNPGRHSRVDRGKQNVDRVQDPLLR
jgi:hypothetical protein